MPPVKPNNQITKVTRAVVRKQKDQESNVI